MNFADARAQLSGILTREGVREALIFLNSLTHHRFSALYRFDNEMLKNLYFFDRENPETMSSDQIPILASYCVFVRDSGQKFTVSDSIQDVRVSGHPKQKQVLSYCGVPLLDKNGRMFGTICHFDLRPVPISAQNVELMEAFALLLKGRDHLTNFSQDSGDNHGTRVEK